MSAFSNRLPDLVEMTGCVGGVPETLGERRRYVSPGRSSCFRSIGAGFQVRTGTEEHVEREGGEAKDRFRRGGGGCLPACLPAARAPGRRAASTLRRFAENGSRQLIQLPPAASSGQRSPPKLRLAGSIVRGRPTHVVVPKRQYRANEPMKRLTFEGRREPPYADEDVRRRYKEGGLLLL
jgi:hypothetical protein